MDLKERINELCCKNLNIKDYSEVEGWFQKSHNGEYWIKGLHEVSEYLKKNKNTPILICGDYDVDGDASIAILFLMFKEAGFTNVRYRAPRRFSEGFGLNEAMIDEADSGIIITCDNGIAASKAIDKAKAKGLTVIVTDHHLPVMENGNPIFPNADAIIDPNAIPESAAFGGYCGAGICYKLAVEMLGKTAFTDKLKALAACATVADVMELREENFVIVKEGLELMADRNVTVGLKALLDEFKIEVPFADDIGFRIGPALNAPGRLIDDGSLWSANLLMETDKEKAKKTAKRLHNVNERRKELVDEGMEKITKAISEGKMEHDTFITVYVSNVSEGIIGILAGQATERYGVPSIVFTDTEGGLLKGSGRSSTANLKKLLDAKPEDFVRYGGHSGAAGVTIKADTLGKLRQDMLSLTKDILPATVDKYAYDIEIAEEEIEEAYEEMSKYAPFGQGNPPIKFKISGFEIEEKKPLGKGIKLISANGHSAIAFDDFDISNGIYGTLSANIFKGKEEIQIMLN